MKNKNYQWVTNSTEHCASKLWERNALQCCTLRKEFWMLGEGEKVHWLTSSMVRFLDRHHYTCLTLEDYNFKGHVFWVFNLKFDFLFQPQVLSCHQHHNLHLYPIRSEPAPLCPQPTDPHSTNTCIVQECNTCTQCLHGYLCMAQ